MKWDIKGQDIACYVGEVPEKLTGIIHGLQTDTQHLLDVIEEEVSWLMNHSSYYADSIDLNTLRSMGDRITHLNKILEPFKAKEDENKR